MPRMVDLIYVNFLNLIALSIPNTDYCSINLEELLNLSNRCSLLGLFGGFIFHFSSGGICALQRFFSLRHT